MTHAERAKAWKREDISRRREAARIEENFGRPYSDQDSHDSLAEQFREVGREATSGVLHRILAYSTGPKATDVKAAFLKVWDEEGL